MINFQEPPSTEVDLLAAEEALKNISTNESQLLNPPSDEPKPQLEPQAEILVASNDSATTSTTTENITDESGNSTEDSPIPLFSEWAHKQMQEAEQKQREDEENGSVTTTSNKPSGHQLPVVKLRAKNYASPDCGAKVLAANSRAQSSANVLTSSRDEYFLSPCTERIWFVVELCEPIQVEKIDIANFELFSSSLKDFKVFVNNRYPTREWQKVGAFMAKDERTVQNFTLDVQGFGKFVRVEIQSHYNAEHYCPVSLFRVFGTSEFEAFETENQPFKIVESEDFEDDEDAEASNNKNLFKVMQETVGTIVNRVLGKESQSRTNQSDSLCYPISYSFECSGCNESVRAGVEFQLQCQRPTLSRLKAQKCIPKWLRRSSYCRYYASKTFYSYVTVMLRAPTLIALCNELNFNASCFLALPPIPEKAPETIVTAEEVAKSKEIVENVDVSAVVHEEPKEEVTQYQPSDTQIPTPPRESQQSEEIETFEDSSVELQNSKEENVSNAKSIEEIKEKENNENWENLEKAILALNVTNGVETTTQSSSNGHGNGQKVQQTEGVVVRLSNRIKVRFKVAIL